jgi:GDP-D-mannose 3',5'-epimerase
MKTAYIGGGAGFIGHHMARRLKSDGYWVRVVDIKEYEYGDVTEFCDEFILADLRDVKNVESTLRLNSSRKYSYYPEPFEERMEFDEVYVFCCLMGGAGFVFSGEHDANIMHDSALMNLNFANTLRNFKGKLFYSSSACMYPQEIQRHSNSPGLKESDAYPGNPDSEYGWEKLFSERLYLAYARNYNLNVRIARFHNIYGPEGTYKGGKEKAPAAMCRKVVESIGYKPGEGGLLSDVIEVWGSGNQTRSFLYIDDCIDAVRLLMDSDFKEPINIGSEEMVTINQLAQMAIDISGKDIKIKNISGPTGVMGRNSDNTLIRQVLNGWEPKVKLREGLEKTFFWIKSQYDGL